MQRKIFKRLESYCMEICAIEGLKTYIIAPKCHTEWINDIELHSALEIHQEADRYISWIEKVHKMNKADLFFAIVHCPGRKRLEWFPVECYRADGQFYHVWSRNTWLCRDCKFVNKGIIIMPFSEIDPYLYYDWVNKVQKWPDIPDIFKKIPCKNCGKLLQNHLVFMETEDTKDVEFYC